MSEVWLIRHGESISNANLPTGDPSQSALTEKGVAEAEQIVKAFVEAPDLIVVSSYLRARQTAVPTQQRFPHIPTEEWPVHEFTYLNPVRYQGTTGTERRPFALAYWERNDPHENEGGAGESFAELMERVQETTARLRQNLAEFIVVFSHGLFLRALVWSILTGIAEATPKAMKRYSHFTQAAKISNGAIIKAQFPVEGPIFISNFDIEHMKK
ncbi:MAG: histidine phosphatase family protein [Chloroflexi bacterium]|nr:histidine phosphatase family protein [Chloroflexota bacterium]